LIALLTAGYGLRIREITDLMKKMLGQRNAAKG